MILKRLKPPKWYVASVIGLLIMLVLKGFWGYIFNYDFPNWLGMLCGLYFVYLAFFARYAIDSKKVNLYEISEYIDVHGSKVVIEELPKEYRYENEDISRLKRNIFRLEYDAFFEKAVLTRENGAEIKISKEDYEFLESINKERGVK